MKYRSLFAAAALVAAPVSAEAGFVYPDQLPILSGAFGAGAATTVDLAGPQFGRLTTVTGPGGGANRATVAVPPNLDMWVQRNVGGTASVGITTHYPRDLHGSAYFAGASGDSKADLEYYFSAPRNLSDLSTFKYEWYRDSTSTIAAHLHPVMRLWVADQSTFNGTTFTSQGYLVFEGVYNGQAVAPVDAWTLADIFNAKFWSTGTLPFTFDEVAHGWTLAQWNAHVGNDLLVIGLSAGIGSGWAGTFSGAVDNIMVAFDGANPFNGNFNFEVPEPGTLAVFGLGLGLLGLAALRRRRADDAATDATAATA